MDPKPPSGHTSPVTSPKQGTAQASVNDETINTSPGSDSSHSSPSAHESANRSQSLTQSPPVQVMERPDDFDFSSRFSSPSSEWSSASDESLFSIHVTSSCPPDQSHLLAADALSFVEHSSQSDTGSLRVETLTKLDGNLSDLDEPQKVVRWKTQVERLADEGVKSHDQQPESSSSADHKPSEPKKKFCWSTCNCGSCNLSKWSSCWNGCWTKMSKSCSKCKPKKKESNAPTGAAPKKPDSKPQKQDSKERCSCSWCPSPSSWSCPCNCCLGEIAM